MTITDVTVLNCAGTPSHTTTTVTIVGSCVNVSTTGTSIGTDTVCIVACDASTGICDTTVIITTVPPTQDTIRDTNQIGTTTTVCVPLESGFTPTSGTIINCGHSNNSGNVYSVDNNGCVTITRSNVVGYNLDTLCVVVCDAQNNCDTTTVIVSNTPKRDTIHDTICVGCASKCMYQCRARHDDNRCYGIELCRHTITYNHYGNNHGSCVNVSTTGTSIGTDTVCIVACDASTGICDTTVIITTVECPIKDTITIDTSICQGQIVIINGNNYDSTGIYYSSNNDTCPIVTKLNLVVNQISSVTINATTCIAANAGTTIDTLVGSNGCDSIVTTITTLLPSSATTLNATSCNPQDTGTVVRTLTAANGCDSIVTTITTLAPFSSVTINTTTCIAANAGTTIDTLVGSNGCDSIVTTITTLLPSSALTLNATSCNPNDTGTIVRTLTAANGCDSIVTTITTLAPFSSVTINATTCNAANAGTTIDTLVGSNGCDSIVTTITTLLPSSATTLNTTSCNPNDTGTVVRTLTAANGCDSIVTTITTLAPFS
ncbi:MAG: hypothetical protein IPL21_12725 [Saprospirales bacterium]|nr:hypothetical protein [Saprospirales bacterium]